MKTIDINALRNSSALRGPLNRKRPRVLTEKGYASIRSAIFLALVAGATTTYLILK